MTLVCLYSHTTYGPEIVIADSLTPKCQILNYLSGSRSTKKSAGHMRSNRATDLTLNAWKDQACTLRVSLHYGINGKCKSLQDPLKLEADFLLRSLQKMRHDVDVEQKNHTQDHFTQFECVLGSATLLGPQSSRSKTQNS